VKFNEIKESGYYYVVGDDDDGGGGKKRVDLATLILVVRGEPLCSAVSDPEKYDFIKLPIRAELREGVLVNKKKLAWLAGIIAGLYEGAQITGSVSPGIVKNVVKAFAALGVDDALDDD